MKIKELLGLCRGGGGREKEMERGTIGFMHGGHKRRECHFQ